MSYILDALRKSDEQRRRGATPTLLTPQAATVTPGRSGILSYGLPAAVVLVGAGIAIGSLRPWQTGQPVPAQKSPPAVQSVPALAAAALEPQVPEVAKIERKNRSRKAPREAVAVVREEAKKPETDKADGARPGDPAQEQKVVAFAELPVFIQEEMPKLSISVHAYSPVPRDRLVGINDRVLREGENVAPGLLLEQITLDGMIMSYRGYRFRRGVR